MEAGRAKPPGHTCSQPRALMPGPFVPKASFSHFPCNSREFYGRVFFVDFLACSSPPSLPSRCSARTAIMPNRRRNFRIA